MEVINLNTKLVGTVDEPFMLIDIGVVVALQEVKSVKTLEAAELVAVAAELSQIKLTFALSVVPLVFTHRILVIVVVALAIHNPSFSLAAGFSI